MDNKYKIATIINYCTNDYKFIGHCIKEAKLFSDQVIVPVCDHFLDGTPENRELLEKTYKENSDNVEFYEYKYDNNVFENLEYCAVHACSRLEGFRRIKDDIDYIIFLDADEIIEGTRFKEFLDRSDFNNYNALSFSSYYYFREVTLRANKLQDSTIMVNKRLLTSDMLNQVIAGGYDRTGIGGIDSVVPGEKMRNIPGLDGKPMIHHYSWVRTKDEMLKKVQTFGHKSDGDWISLVENEFSQDFKGIDFIHGYKYEVVEPYITIGNGHHVKGHEITRSFIIPVLDYSPHSPYNIETLLKDLENIPGEVICVFNSIEVFDKLHNHPRIDKYCFNSLNAGVSRSWNIGINMAEGRTAFILNADVHIRSLAVSQLESYLLRLDKAVIVGPQGAIIDYKNHRDKKYYGKGTFREPVKVDAVSGFLFAIHLERYIKNNLLFDVQFSPCFYEEWDIGLQIMQAGLACYAIPVTDFEHHMGASQDETLSVNYFGRNMSREDILPNNRERFIAKWKNDISSEESGGLNLSKAQRFECFLEKVKRETYPEPVADLPAAITEKTLDMFLKKHSLPENSRVLDVGCGQGVALELFKKERFSAVGITLNSEDVSVCRRKGYEVYEMDQSFLEFDNEEFDFIWCRHCLEHSIFPYFTLSELFRVLKRNGYLYIEVPAPDTISNHHINKNHYSVLGKKMWLELIKRTGFNILDIMNIPVQLKIGEDLYWAFVLQKP